MLSSNTVKALQPAVDPLRVYLEALPEWLDQMRVDSLFSNLSRLRAANPVAYDRNVQFWRSVILTAADNGWCLDPAIAVTTKCDSSGVRNANPGSGASLLVVTEDSLAARFQRKSATPSGIGAVLAEMEKSGEVIPLSKFTSPASGSRGAWNVPQTVATWVFRNLVWTPLAWTFRQIIPIDPEHDKATFAGRVSRNEAMVLIPTLRKTADQLLRQHYASMAYPITDNLMTVTELLSRMQLESHDWQILTLSNLDKDIIIRHWVDSGSIIVKDAEQQGLGTIVKFRQQGRDSKKSLELTKTDKGIIQIMETRKSVARQMEDLEYKISDILVKARVDVKISHRKGMVLSSLRRKKFLSEVLDKRVRSLETLDNVLLKIQNAATDGEIVQAYNIAADSLQSVLQSSGLDVDSVDSALDKLSEVMANQREIEDAVHAGSEEIRATAGVAVDESVLEAELDELLRKDEEEKRKAEESQVEAALATAAAPPTNLQSILESNTETERVGRERRIVEAI